MPRTRTQVNFDFISGNNYLKSTIRVHKTDKTLVLCTVCNPEAKPEESEWILWENLEKHLTRESHLKKAISKIRDKESFAAAQYLKEIRELKKVKGGKKGSISTSELASVRMNPNNIEVEEAFDETEEQKNKISQVSYSNSEEFFQFQITKFIIANNLPFSIAENLTKFIQEVNEAHSLEAQAGFNCKDSHVSKFASKSIAPMLKEQYLLDLETKPFSLAIDEASKGNISYLAISATYFLSPKDAFPRTKIIALIKVQETASGEALFNAIWNFFIRRRSRSSTPASFCRYCY